MALSTSNLLTLPTNNTFNTLNSQQGVVKPPSLSSYLPSTNYFPSISLNTQTTTPQTTKPLALAPPQSTASASAPTTSSPNPNYGLFNYGTPSATGGASSGTSAPTQSYTPQAPLPTVNPNQQYNTGTNQTQTQGTPVTYPGLVSTLANSSLAGSSAVPQAQQGLLNSANSNPLESGGAYDTYSKAIAAQNALKQGIASSYANVEQNPIPLEFQQGREQVMSRQYASQLDAAQQAVNQAQQALGYGIQEQGQQQAGFNQAGALGNTAQGLKQSGLTSAAGLAQPQLGNIGSQQYYNPLNPGQSGGMSVGSALASLPQSAQTAIQSYAQQVKSGSMTRADAESRLSAYGITGTNALNEVLGSGFNTNASNASAGTTAVGQQVQTAAISTNAALDTLATAFSNLSPLQTGGIPASNSIANWIASNLGDQALTQFKTNLADARSQLIGVLNASGGTPTGNEATALQYLPDNMTKAQFDANVGTTQNPGIVRQLIDQKVKAFTGSGQQNTNQGNTSGGSIFSW